MKVTVFTFVERPLGLKYTMPFSTRIEAVLHDGLLHLFSFDTVYIITLFHLRRSYRIPQREIYISETSVVISYKYNRFANSLSAGGEVCIDLIY